MAKAKTTTKSTYTVTRRILHDGEPYGVGDTIELNDGDAQHLVLGKHIVPAATPAVVVVETAA